MSWSTICLSPQSIQEPRKKYLKLKNALTKLTGKIY